jgi:periplasmic copper chaperone A
MTIIQAGCARPFGALALAAIFITGFAIPRAAAHVSLANAETAPNSTYRAVLRVPHGCDGAATTSVRVQIPEGVIAARPMPKAGWTLTTTRGAYAKPYENHGRTVSEGVKEIVWSGGSLADDHFDEFTFTAVVATDGGAAKAVYFPTVQQCTKGEAAWTDIPATGQSSRDLKKPAPALRISANAMVAQAGGGHDHHAASAKAGADTFKVGDITIASAWTRATPGGAKVAGGYLKLTNNGTAADKLLGATTDIAGRVEVHEMAMDGNVMRMRPLNAGLEIKPGQTIEFSPGGFHIMFMNLKRQLKQGETIKATLKFEKAGTVDVTFNVSAVGGASAPHHHH